MPKRSTPWWLIPVAVMAAAAGMGLLGLWQLGAAEQLSSLLRGQRIQQRIETILMPSGAAAATQLHDGAQRLVDEAELGLVYVSLASGSGEVVAVAGRFEKWDFGVLPRSATRGLRQLAYRWAGRAQLVEWPADAAWPYGARIRFVVAPGIGQPPDAAVSRLAWSGTLSFLLGLLAALPVPTLWRRAIRPPTPWAERLAPEARPGHGPVDIEQRVYEQLPERLGDWLDQLDQALIVVDSEASVRYLNETAGALTGWAPADVQGRLVYSVFHPLDSRYSPMLTPVEICLRDEAPYAASELRLRARDGTQRSIEVMAVPVRRPSGLLDGALMVFHDISNREKRIDQWRRQARNAQSVVDHLTEGVLTTDPVGVIRFANAHALRMFGYVWEELDGVTVSKLMPVPFLNSPSVRLTDYIGGEGAVGLPKVVGWRRDATTFPVELVVQNMTIEHAQGLLVIVRDITERLRSDNLAQRLGRLLDAAAEEVYIFDAQTLRFVEINRGARRNLGYHASEMTNMTPLVISEQIDTETYQHYLNRLRDGEAEHVTYRCQHRRADGSAYPVEVRLNYSREEEPPVFMAIAVDITEREAAEQRLQYLAHHDALTGLPNRAMLADRLNQAMLATLRSSRLLGLLYLDVDHFKQINDQHGHDAGDRVLKQVAERLQRLVRASDTIARLGGDEFVLVLPGLRHEHDALALGDKIVDAFAAPVRLNDNLSIRIGASVGAVICPRGERDAERLLREADQAMYESKQAGRGRCTFRRIEVSPEESRRSTLESEVSSALALGQLEIEMRSIQARDTQTAIAQLADFAWQHPQFGRIESAEVLACARRSGAAADVELWCLKEALDSSSRAPGTFDIIVPVSASQWRHPEFSPRVLEVLHRSGLPGHRLRLASDAAGIQEALDPTSPHWQSLAAEKLGLVLIDSAERMKELPSIGMCTQLAMMIIDLPVDLNPAIPESAPLEVLRGLLSRAQEAAVPVVAARAGSPALRQWLEQRGCLLELAPAAR